MSGSRKYWDLSQTFSFFPVWPHPPGSSIPGGFTVLPIPHPLEFNFLDFSTCTCITLRCGNSISIKNKTSIIYFNLLHLGTVSCKNVVAAVLGYMYIVHKDARPHIFSNNILLTLISFWLENCFRSKIYVLLDLKNTFSLLHFLSCTVF